MKRLNQEMQYFQNIFVGTYTYKITTKNGVLFTGQIPAYLVSKIDDTNRINLDTFRTLLGDLSRQGFDRSQVDSVTISPIPGNGGETITTQSISDIMNNFGIALQGLDNNMNAGGGIYIKGPDGITQDIHIRFLPYARILMEKYFNHALTESNFFNDFEIVTFLRTYPSLYTIKPEDKVLIDQCVENNFIGFQYCE